MMKKVLGFSTAFLSGLVIVLFFTSAVSGFGGERNLVLSFFNESLKNNPTLKTELSNMGEVQKEVRDYRRMYEDTKRESIKYYNDAAIMLSQIQDPELKKLADNRLKSNQSEFNSRISRFELRMLPFDGLIRMDNDLEKTIQLIYSLKIQDDINASIKTDTVRILNLKNEYQSQIDKVKAFAK